MGAPGPTPKDASKRERRNAETFPSTVLSATSAPARARALPGASKLLAVTRRQWRIWATSPQAAHFLETDWLALERLARLWDAFNRGDLRLGTEIRQLEAKLGATPDDRLRLRWRMAEGADADDRAQRTSARQPRRRSDPRLKLVESGPS